MPRYHFKCHGEVVRIEVEMELLGQVFTKVTRIVCEKCGDQNPLFYEAPAPILGGEVGHYFYELAQSKKKA